MLRHIADCATSGSPGRLRPYRRDTRRRRGATLLELMLVMAVIVMVIGLTWPMLERPFAYEKLRNAADIVRSEWTTARVEAMRSGEYQIFRFQPQSGVYEVPGKEAPESRELPEGVTFVSSLKTADGREASEGGSQDAASPEIWFYPDGTSSDVPELLLRNEEGMQIRLVLRGLTGVAVVDQDVPNAVDAVGRAP
jgi:Tfp pilus assembly protein FimT